MTNDRIADTFELIADLLEFTDANPFRVRAYRSGARRIRELQQSVSSMLEQDADLTELEGIGKDLAEKCETLVATGELALLNELLEQVPQSVLALLRVPGLGPKKAAVLHRELQISTLDELQLACEQQRVRDLKGFGKKTEEQILKGLAVAAQANQRTYWAKADHLVQQLLKYFRGCEAVEKIEVAGSYRRGRETVGDLDLLVVSSQPETVMDHFAAFEDVADVSARGDTKMSVRVASGLQIDLRVVPTESFGAALQYFTGSKEHNVILRGLAKQKGLRINEYGVYRVTERDEAGERVAGTTEEEVYQTLGLPCFPPELREGRKEFEWAEQGQLPRLIELTDLRGDLHMHTTATDGKASLREMVNAARDRGLDYIAITDHSQRVSMAQGLDPTRLLAQWQEIDRLQEEIDGKFRVLKGIECDILEAGGMDLPDEILAQADWVLGSIHYGQRQSREQITDRILGALENPYVSAIAHPTGRLLLEREAYEVDLDAVFAAAKKHRKLLELNANPARLDLNDVLCAAAKAHQIPIVISTDAHSIAGLDVMRYGVLQARRAGLTKQDVANALPWDKFRAKLPSGLSQR